MFRAFSSLFCFIYIVCSAIKRIHILRESVATDLLEDLSDPKATELLPFVSQSAPYHPQFRTEIEGEQLLQTYSSRSYTNRFQNLPFPINIAAPLLENLFLVPPQTQSTLFVSNFRTVLVNHTAYSILQYKTTSSSEYLQNLQRVEVENETIPQPLYRRLGLVHQAIFALCFAIIPILNFLVFVVPLTVLPPWTFAFFCVHQVCMVAYLIVSIILTKKLHYNPFTIWKASGTSVELKVQLVAEIAKTLLFYVVVGLMILLGFVPFIIMLASLVISEGATFGDVTTYTQFWIAMYGIEVVIAVLFVLSYVLYPSSMGHYHAKLKIYFGNASNTSAAREQVVILRAIDAEEVKSLLLHLRSDVQMYNLNAESYVVEGSHDVVSNGNSPVQDSSQHQNNNRYTMNELMMGGNSYMPTTMFIKGGNAPTQQDSQFNDPVPSIDE